MNHYYVYIMSNKTKVLYIGATNSLEKRVWQHKEGKGSAFTTKYRTKRLVYFEETTDVKSAITREKQLKGWLRKKKVELIEAKNPTWQDLSTDWYDQN